MADVPRMYVPGIYIYTRYIIGTSTKYIFLFTFEGVSFPILLLACCADYYG